MSLQDVIEAYAVALEGYYRAEKKFIAEPTALNVTTLHRHLDRILFLRGEIARSQRMSDAVFGAQTEAEIQKFTMFLDKDLREREAKTVEPSASD